MTNEEIQREIDTLEEKRKALLLINSNKLTELNSFIDSLRGEMSNLQGFVKNLESIHMTGVRQVR